MKKSLLISTVIPIVMLTSCGESAKEKQLEQNLNKLTRYQDSVKQDKIKKVAESKLKWARAQAGKNMETDKQKLVIENTKLLAAQQELNNIEGFHPFRSAARKQEQIQFQALEIQKIQDTISAINNRIDLDNGNLTVWIPNNNYKTIYVDGIYIGSTQGAGISNGVTTYVNPSVSHTINGNTLQPFSSSQKMRYELQ